MKITETNSEQLDIKESGIGAAFFGAVLTLGGLGSVGWVAMNTSSFTWWWAIVGVGVAGIGVFVIYSSSNRHLTLRRQGMSDIVTTRLIGGKQSHVSFERSQIISVNLITSDEVRTTGSGDSQTTTYERVSRLYLLLSDNSEVPLATSRGSNGGVSVNGVSLGGINKAPLADEAQRIAVFYGVPLSDHANNVGGIEAVAGVVGVIKQGISSVQQSVANMPPQAPPSSQPMTAPPVTQSTMSIATPIQQATAVATDVQPVIQATPTTVAPSLVSEPATTREQLPR